MPRFGLDYTGTLSVAAHKAAGSTFACRYLRELTKSEADMLRAGGIDVVVVHERAATEALGGRAAGRAAASLALGEAQAAGIPGGRPIFFAIDFDETAAQAGAVADYFRGVHDILDNAGPASFPTPVPVGAYGGYWPVKRLFDAGLISYGWQTYAWSGGLWDPRAGLQQYSNDHVVAGHGVDFDRAVKPDFGQWDFSQPQPPAPQPPEGTVAIAAVQNEDGRLEIFVELSTGEVKHIAQQTANGTWWQDSSGNYTWLSLGNPGK